MIGDIITLLVIDVYYFNYMIITTFLIIFNVDELVLRHETTLDNSVHHFRKLFGIIY